MPIQDIKAQQRAAPDALVAERRHETPEAMDDATRLALKRKEAAAFRRFLGHAVLWIVAAVLAFVMLTGLLALIAVGGYLGWWGIA
jgi:hypothetical protein